MQVLNRHISFLFAAVLFGAVLFMVYPYYQYCIDTDATSYLTISQRYAAGDYSRAINGYWSPWACWLTAIGIRAGFAPFTAAIIVNGIAAICFLFISHSFLLLFGIEKKFRRVLEATIALFLVYAVFKQSFADLWECFFLLTGLRIMLHKSFAVRWDLWVWLGIAGGFAYYAKAYSFPFFILNTLCCVFFISRTSGRPRPVLWLKISLTAIAVMFVVAAPWIYLLHWKYGIWMTSTAGTLNLSWYPAGHPHYKEGIQHLLPPVYGDSPSYWEDPWMVNGHRPYFWHSGYFFMRQLARIGYNLLLFVKSLCEMSLSMLPAFGLALTIVLSKKTRHRFEQKHLVLALSFMLFPLGFLPINYEARYIWYMLLPGLVLAASVVQKIDKTKGYLPAIIIFALSFLAYPLWDMKQMFREGEQEHALAQEMQQQGIRGSFTSNVTFSGGGDALQSVTRLAYFSGNPYYNIPFEITDFKEVIKDARRYQVKYFFYYSEMPQEAILYDENSLPLPVIATFSDMRIFALYP